MCSSCYSLAEMNDDVTHLNTRFLLVESLPCQYICRTCLKWRIDYFQLGQGSRSKECSPTNNGNFKNNIFYDFYIILQ